LSLASAKSVSKCFEMEKLIKHDKYVQELCASIASDYDSLFKNVPIYSKRKRLIAEIDILAKKDGYYDIYEVKCSDRVTKAKQQLKKIRKVISRSSKVRKTFFFCGESRNLVPIPQN